MNSEKSLPILHLHCLQVCFKVQRNNQIKIVPSAEGKMAAT